MARTLKDAKLETRAARARLPVGPRAHWKTLIPGQLHLGYRRKLKGTPGIWLVRHYKGHQRYHIWSMGLADDTAEVDGLSFGAAQKAALAYRPHEDARRTRPGGITVEDAVADYVSALQADRAPRAAKDATARAALHILPKLGQVRVASLTARQLTAWRDQIAQAPAMVRAKASGKRNTRPGPETEDGRRARRSTVNRLVNDLKAALNLAYRHDLVSDNKQWSGAKFASFENADAARPHSLSLAEATRLINAADAATGTRNLIHAALLTGCRYGELATLNVRDFANGKIAVHRSKSGKPRDVRLTEEGEKFFAQLCAGRAAEEPMLRNKASARWKKSEQTRPMIAACAAAKIVPAVGLHAMRHTYASLAVMNGVPLMVIAHNLGHTDTRMVEKHYGHLTENYMDEAIHKGAPRFGITPTNVEVLKG